MVSDRPVLIEATSKKWKVYQLLGAAVVLLGVVILILAVQSGSSSVIRASAVIQGAGVLIILVGVYYIRQIL